MLLTCKHCGYTQEVRSGKLPPPPYVFTCPQCRYVEKITDYGDEKTFVMPYIPWRAVAASIALITLLLLGWFFFSGTIHTEHIDSYQLTASSWQGKLGLEGSTLAFELNIDRIDPKGFSGKLSWVGASPVVHRTVKGTHKGNHLVFFDYDLQETKEGTDLLMPRDNPYYRKDVYIMGDVMAGTDMGGMARLVAKRTVVR